MTQRAAKSPKEKGAGANKSLANKERRASKSNPQRVDLSASPPSTDIQLPQGDIPILPQPRPPTALGQPQSLGSMDTTGEQQSLYAEPSNLFGSDIDPLMFASSFPGPSDGDNLFELFISKSIVENSWWIHVADLLRDSSGSRVIEYRLSGIQVG